MTATIKNLRAHWLWQLAEVSRPLPDSGSDIYAGKIRIAQHEGCAILAATSGTMLTVVRDAASEVTGLDQPITLSIDGELRRRMSQAGKHGRPKQTISIGIAPGETKHNIGIDIDGPQGCDLRGDDAYLSVDIGRHFPDWRGVLPDTPAIIESWSQAPDQSHLDGMNLGLLQKVPRFGGGSILIQPVLLDHKRRGRGRRGQQGQPTTSSWLIRESDTADFAFSLAGPLYGDKGCKLTAPLPDFTKESQPPR